MELVKKKVQKNEDAFLQVNAIPKDESSVSSSSSDSSER